MTKSDETEFVQVIFRIPRSLRRAVKMEAAAEERTMNQVFISALRAYFNAPKGQGPRKKK